MVLDVHRAAVEMAFSYVGRPGLGLHERALDAAEPLPAILRRWVAVGADVEIGPALRARFGAQFVLALYDNARRDGDIDAMWLADLSTTLGRAGLRGVILHTTGGRSLDAADCRWAFPDPWILGDLADHEDDLWARYLHLRLGWEAGGDLGRVKLWAEEMVAVRQDDEELERAANRLSLQAWDETPPEARESFLAWLAGGAEDVAALTDLGLVLSPAVGIEFRPTAWVARALLLTKSAPRATLLRDSVVCAPLRAALLELCFAFEWSIRDRLSDRPAHDLVPDADGSQHRDFVGADNPAAAATSTDLCSFGRVLVHHADADRRLRSLLPVMNARNTLAHGHPVGFAAVRSLRRAREAMDRLGWRRA